MALTSRTGEFGRYYGNDYYSSDSLTQSQMEVNAKYIYSYLLNEGWTANAIAGMLGNMQYESSINPGRWQSDRVEGDASGHGYGLVQWTPYTKYTNWCTANGYNDPSEMDTNLARIIYEVEHSIQWIAVGSYSDMTFEEFTKSSLPPSELAKAFVLCYERPADQSTSVQNKRGNAGNEWYEYLTGITPSTPINTTKRKRYKFVLFNRRRRHG